MTNKTEKKMEFENYIEDQNKIMKEKYMKFHDRVLRAHIQAKMPSVIAIYRYCLPENTFSDEQVGGILFNELIARFTIPDNYKD